MKKLIFASALVLIIVWSTTSYAAEPKFEKVSEHCYYLDMDESGENIAIVATEDGVLMVNPPREAELDLFTTALKHTTSKSVKWIVFTDPHFAGSGRTKPFADAGAYFLASARLRAIANRIIVKTDSENTGASKTELAGGSQDFLSELTFDRQMNLFPSNLEIRILAVQPRARTGGDVVVHVPAEKVLFVGDFFEKSRFPDIDVASEGSAVGWIEGLKQVIELIPLLKSAIPPPKPEPKPEQEKTLEEKIVVVSSHGEISNLQDMKDLLEVSQKLRADVSRSVKVGRTWDSFIASPIADPYRKYGNLASFSARLFEEMAPAAK